MRKIRDIPERGWELVIVLTTIIWGASYVVIRGALDAAAPGWVLALRFGIAAVVLAVAFRRQLRESLDGSHLLCGVIIGASGAAAYLAQNIGLTMTTVGRNAFLTAVYCVMVPFLSAALAHRAPRASDVVGAILALAGVGLVSLSAADAQPGLSSGDWLTLLSAVLFAINIISIERFAHAHDPATLVVVQLVVMALLSLAWALVMEPVPAFGSLPRSFWLEIAYVSLLSTAFACVVQNFAQVHVEAARASLLYSLESVFGVVFSVIILHEELTLQLVLGFVLIFAAILVSELGVGMRRECP